MGTKSSAADVLLHPQRLAIIRALIGNELTTKQLAARVADIPQATLYRHLTALLEVGAITVVSERKVRGTPQRTYALGPKALLTNEAFEHATPEEHFRYFTTYVAGLLDEYGRYLERPHIDLEADGVGYRDIVLNLSDDEFRAFLADLRAVIAARAENPATPDRTPRMLSTVFIPVDRQTGTTQ